MTTRAVGIDLGTTFSAIAHVNKYGVPEILHNAEGERITPSVVLFEGEEVIIGTYAKQSSVAYPEQVVEFIKRHMGDEDFTFEYRGEAYTPERLSGFILAKLKHDAELRLGHRIDQAVITVPAYFGDKQRRATIRAGEYAGLRVLSLLNEPTAAAFAYGFTRTDERKRLLVFDLGGGTFDVTVMEIRGTNLRTIATDGNAELGGKDFDDRLLNHVAEQFLQKFGLDPRDEPQPYQELYERCLHAKISLSSKPRAVIPVNFRGQRTVVPVTREEFESISQDLVEQCADTCAIVLEKAKMRWSDIDDVLLAGGSTRMPIVQDMLRRLSGKVPVAGVNPDECVALGASLAAVFRHRPKHPAIQAYRQNLARRGRPEALDDPRSSPSSGTQPSGSTHTPSSSPGLPGVRIADVATHPLGIVVLDSALRERIVPLIPAFTPLPCEKRGRFAYAQDGMTAVRVEVTEGVGESRDEVTVIGEVILDNLPPRPRGTPIEVVYRYTLNQILEVDVTDVETRQTRRATIVLRGSLGSEGLDAARKRMATASIH